MSNKKDEELIDIAVDFDVDTVKRLLLGRRNDVTSISRTILQKCADNPNTTIDDMLHSMGSAIFNDIIIGIILDIIEEENEKLQNELGE